MAVRARGRLAQPLPPARDRRYALPPTLGLGRRSPSLRPRAPECDPRGKVSGQALPLLLGAGGRWPRGALLRREWEPEELIGCRTPVNGCRTEPRQVLVGPRRVCPAGVLVHWSRPLRRTIVGVDDLQSSRQPRGQRPPPRSLIMCPRVIGSRFRGLAAALPSVNRKSHRESTSGNQSYRNQSTETDEPSQDR